MRQKLDLKGKKFGRLTVLGFAGVSRSHNSLWLCRCECGNEIIAHSQRLIGGRTKSCGCYRRDFTTRKNIAATEHPDRRSSNRLYRTWTNMITRCYRPYCHAYKNYGGRGITICDEWKNSFETFQEWALQNGYREDLTIDRIDVNGNYEPQNCRWVTMLVQRHNRRDTIKQEEI